MRSAEIIRCPRVSDMVYLNRFTTYDFKKMHRRSYYPHNQQLASTVTATSSTGLVSSRPVTPSVIDAGSDGVNGIGMRSLHTPDNYDMNMHHGEMNNMSEKELH